MDETPSSHQRADSAPSAGGTSENREGGSAGACGGGEGTSSSDSLPICVIVIGMAGSGKTTLLQRIHKYVLDENHASYFVNLDPAVNSVPFGANIDIRDTVNYKQVMKQYSLGPNGGIVTALNLFSTRFDQVLQFVQQKASKLKYVFIDTPGQIEIFTWSASGAIITEALASSFPTVVLYVVDTPRTANPVTFMSNMLYACSILYKTQLPFVLVFNKTDVMSPQFAIDWMTDFDAFHAALQGEKSYAGTLARSMGLVLDEFYASLKFVGVSAVTGDGMSDLFDGLRVCAQEYDANYKVEYEKKKAAKERKEAQRAKKSMERLKKDMAASGGHPVVVDATSRGSRYPDDDSDSSASDVSIASDSEDGEEVDDEDPEEAQAFALFQKELAEQSG